MIWLEWLDIMALVVADQRCCGVIFSAGIVSWLGHWLTCPLFSAALVLWVMQWRTCAYDVIGLQKSQVILAHAVAQALNGVAGLFYECIIKKIHK